MHLRRLSLALFVAVLLPALPAGGQTEAPPPTPDALPREATVVVDMAGKSSLAIAIPTFLPSKAGNFPIEAVSDVNRTFLADIAATKVFARVDPTLYPENPGSTLDPAATGKWRDIGAEVLVAGTLDVEGTGSAERVVLDARVYDLKAGKMIVGRRYSGSVALARRIAHTLANELVQYFTGRPGTFLTKIAFVSDRDGAKEIYVMDADGQGQTRVSAHRSLALHPSWSPDGSSIAYLAYGKESIQLMRLPAGGGKAVALPVGVRVNGSPTYSPEGERIAFVGAKEGNTAIFVTETTGKVVRQLTSFRGLEAAPCWSPNGRELAFTSDRAGTPQIYVMDAEGANVRRLTYEGRHNDMAAWSPDGSKIAFSTGYMGNYQIAVMDILSGQQYVLTESGRNESPAWSPDGKKIAFSSNRNGGEQIFVMNADGSDVRALTSIGKNFSPAWSKVDL